MDDDIKAGVLIVTCIVFVVFIFFLIVYHVEYKLPMEMAKLNYCYDIRVKAYAPCEKKQ